LAADERRQWDAERDRSFVRERDAQRELSDILESITDAFFTLDRERRFTYVNRRAEEFWGRPREELLGHSIWEAFPDAVGSEPLLAAGEGPRGEHRRELRSDLTRLAHLVLLPNLSIPEWGLGLLPRHLGAKRGRGGAARERGTLPHVVRLDR
jgi:PAS domain-containing protein